MNKRFYKLTLAVLFVSILAILFTSCEEEGNLPDIIVKDATTIELVSGALQTGFVNETLEKEIVILVKGMDGMPYEDETVTFEVDEGSVSAETLNTDANGNASVTWTLGPTEGIQSLVITGTSTLDQQPITVIATAEVP